MESLANRKIRIKREQSLTTRRIRIKREQQYYNKGFNNGIFIGAMMGLIIPCIIAVCL
jgi:hypothetical protein